MSLEELRSAALGPSFISALLFTIMVNTRNQIAAPRAGMGETAVTAHPET